MKNKISLLKRIGISAVAGIAGILSAADNLSVQTAASQPAQPSETISIRARAEATSGENSLEQRYQAIKNTFGLTDCTCKEKEGIGEFFRLYDNHSIKETSKGDVKENWTSLGAKYPFKIGQGTLCPAIFGSIGDREGIGTETSFILGGLRVVGNAEKATFPKDATRIGFGADYQFNKWFLAGVGFDRVETEKGETNYFLGKAVFTLTDKDRIGLAFRLADSDSGLTNSVLASYGHTGKDESWGTRTYARYDWNSGLDSKCLSFQSIIAQNPTFAIPASYSWMEGRGNGDMFDVPVADQSVTYAERVPLNYRSKKGLVTQVLGSLTDSAGIKSRSLRGDVGYTFQQFDIGGLKVKPGVVVFDKYDTCQGKDSVNTYGASFIVDFGKILGGNVNFEITGQKSSNSASEVYSGLSLGWRW